MENLGSNKMETVLKNLSLLSRDLPFEAEQAWTFSLHHIENYIREHANNGSLDRQTVSDDGGQPT